MPCDSSYLEPTNVERDSKSTCESLVYALTALEKPVPTWAQNGADDEYGDQARLLEAVVLLCKLCKAMSKEDADRIIYNGRNAKARKLANWYEEHEAFDKRRIAKERKEHEIEKVRETALSKLSKEEQTALGL